MSIVKGDTVTMQVTPQIFQTQALSVYLEHRIDDYLNDPEPAEDDFCERIPKDYLSELLTYLKSSNKIYHASVEAKDNE